MSDLLVGAALGAAVGFLVGAVVFLRWKSLHSRAIRRDAVERSQAVIAGKVSEQLLPYLPGFDYDPKDVRFLGSPVDLVVFDGLSAGRLQRVVFIEVKTGKANLSQREKQVREVVTARRVEWDEWRIDLPVGQAG